MYICCVVVVFFFFKQKTAYEMRISDWSSDVCSSDLFEPRPLKEGCRCSREKLEGVLKAMPRAEIEDMKNNDAVEVTCEFCTTLYRFDDDDLERIYAD